MLTNLPAPFAPLVSGGESLERYPGSGAALAERLAALYAQPVERILPVRGLTHGLELVFRLADRDGLAVEGPDAEPFTRLRGLYRDPPQGADRGAVILRGLASAEVVAEMAERVAPALLVLDEGLVEFAETPSAAPLVEGHANLVVLRSLSMTCPADGYFGLARFGIASDGAGDRLRLPVSASAAVNDRLLAALDLAQPSRPHRIGQAVRDTKETRIVCAVDLDAPGPVAISTGVGFFDHMLEQIAAHGGFSLSLACEGDLHIDPHHTVEDSAIALGQALKQALGERRGIARYGFVLPMDEARASVTLDLSGRPYPVFEGDFATPMIGDYRTDLTAHVFRSLAEHLGAAIHVSVTGDDDHHKTEAAYKAFGRALRQAIRVDGEVVPSTKGVL